MITGVQMLLGLPSILSDRSSSNCWDPDVDYRRRIVEDVLDELFPHLAAIALEGAKGVGKTATQRASTVLSLNNPSERTAVAGHMDLVAEVPGSVLIDEWQLEPDVWDRVRRTVDDDPTRGRFLLAGSAGAAPGVRVHSGAGRIVSLTMRPLAFSERGVAEPCGTCWAGPCPRSWGPHRSTFPDKPTRSSDRVLRGSGNFPSEPGMCNSTVTSPGSWSESCPRAG